MTFDQKGFALYFSRAPIPWDRDNVTPCDIYKHLGIYAYTKRFLDNFRRLPGGVLENIEKLEQLRALEYGHRIKVVITPFDSLEVDIPADIPESRPFYSDCQNNFPIGNRVSLRPRLYRNILMKTILE